MKNYTNRMVWILVGLFGLFWDDRSQVLLVGMRGLGGEREKLGGLLFFDLTPNLYELNWGYTFLVLISPLIQSFHRVCASATHGAPIGPCSTSGLHLMAFCRTRRTG